MKIHLVPKVSFGINLNNNMGANMKHHQQHEMPNEKFPFIRMKHQMKQGEQHENQNETTVQQHESANQQCENLNKEWNKQTWQPNESFRMT